MATGYVETSALMRALLEGDASLDARLARMKRIVTSTLTFLEAHRTLWWAEHEGRVDRRLLRKARQKLRSLEASWAARPIDDAVLQRGRVLFPVEPIRALDAVHVATAVLWHERVEEVVVFSYDQRVRDNAEALGMEVQPLAQAGAGPKTRSSNR
ncbi:MAG: type II toxin-antitoxin system VapC family toxin [Myxococcaceae bacterium]